MVDMGEVADVSGKGNTKRRVVQPNRTDGPQNCQNGVPAFPPGRQVCRLKPHGVTPGKKDRGGAWRDRVVNLPPSGSVAVSNVYSSFIPGGSARSESTRMARPVFITGRWRLFHLLFWTYAACRGGRPPGYWRMRPILLGLYRQAVFHPIGHGI